MGRAGIRIGVVCRKGACARAWSLLSALHENGVYGSSGVAELRGVEILANVHATPLTAPGDAEVPVGSMLWVGSLARFAIGFPA